MTALATLLRWIGARLTHAADRLESPSFATAPLQPRPDYLAAEEFLFDVRHRIQSRYY